MSKLSNYQKGYISFCDFLCNTHKYKELWKEHSAILSIILATIFTYILYDYINFNEEYLAKTIDPLLLSFSAGLFSLLGVYIAGLAIFMSIITKNTLEALNMKNAVQKLVSIFFSFYFIAAFVFMTIVLFSIAYFRLPIASFLKQNLSSATYALFIDKSLISYIWITLFCFFFSISYTVALLGTCINFFFANLYMDKFCSNDEGNSNDNSTSKFIVIIKNTTNK